MLTYNQRPSARAHYEIVQAEIGIEPDVVTIIYRQISSLNGGNAVYKIPTGQLNSIEFSDQLCCIHFIGLVTVTYTGSNLRSENKSGCYFYVEKGYEKEILSELTRTDRGVNLERFHAGQVIRLGGLALDEGRAGENLCDLVGILACKIDCHR